MSERVSQCQGDAVAAIIAINAASIAAFSVLGVATREALTYWFARCPVVNNDEFHPEALCITSSGDTPGGALFTSLPGNMLACFIMGLVVPSSLFSDGDHGSPQPVAVLPKTWRVQWYAPLWLGIRTGYCGSLSTFASWNMQMVEMITEFSVSPVGGQAAAALFGYFIGVALSVSMIMMGIHVAGAVYCGRLKEKAGAVGAGSLVPYQANGELTNGSHPSDPRNEAQSDEVAASSVACVTPAEDYPNGHESATVAGLRVCDAEVALGDEMGACTRKNNSDSRTSSRTGDACVLLLLATVLTVSGLLAAFVPSIRVDGLACIVGPFGAWLRWYLSRFNGSWKAKPWFPVGTFTANVCASAADALLAGLAFHFPGMGSLATGTISIIVTGVNGSLSTVSSMAWEKVELLSLPTADTMKAYHYVVATIAVSVAVGIAVYGPFVWTAARESAA